MTTAIPTPHKAIVLSDDRLEDPEADSFAPEGLFYELHRPERFISHALNGLTEADDRLRVRGIPQLWRTYVKTLDGRRYCSNRRKDLEIDTHFILYRPALRIAPEGFEAGWSMRSREDWLSGIEPVPSPAEVFKSVVLFIHRSVEFAPGAQHDAAVSALWVMMTYFTPLFSALPYLHLQGMPGSGKSTLLDVIRLLAFRPLVTSNITPAALYRYIHEFGGTMLVDEAEQFKGSSDVGRLLNAGYSRGAKIFRTAPDGGVEAFEVFSPKALASINPLNPALASRCIRFGMVPAAKTTTPPDLVHAASLRDSLHVLAMESTFELRDSITRSNTASEVLNRQRDLWGPLLGIARWLEKHGIDTLSAKIERLAKDDSRARSEVRITPEDEQILYSLLRLRLQGLTPTSTEVMRAAMERDAELFQDKLWRPQIVRDRLVEYGVPGTEKSDGRRVFKVPVNELQMLVERHGLNPEVDLKDTQHEPASEGARDDS